MTSVEPVLRVGGLVRLLPCLCCGVSAVVASEVEVARAGIPR